MSITNVTIANDTMKQMNGKTFNISKRCFEFAVEIIRIVNILPKTPAGFAIADQIIRSGTSVGANVEEAQDANSKKDFIRTMVIALKECRETLYWLSLIYETRLLNHEELEALISEGKELRSILATIIKNSKQNL